MADTGGQAAPDRRGNKSPEAFRTISEVAAELDVPPHVLRFWESKFAQVKPLKRGGRRRYYRPEDVELLRGIRTLLYNDGYTIRGVQKVLREKGVKGLATASASTGGNGSDRAQAPARGGDARAAIGAAIEELEALSDLLRKSRD